MRRCRRGALMEYDLRKALAAGEFELHYQPVVNLESNEISGVEALIRWRHPEKGIIPPSAFIPVAEEIGFIVPLGEWAIREACATAAKWPGDVRIAVNLSPIQFRNPGFVQVVVERAGDLGPGGRPARARDHRKHPAARQRGDALHALSAARARRAHRHGRFRHRLLLAQLPAELPVRQDQDRPLVREGHRRRRRLAQHRARGGGDGQRARHDAPPPRASRPRSSSRPCGPRAAPRCRASCSAGRCPAGEIEQLLLARCKRDGRRRQVRPRATPPDPPSALHAQAVTCAAFS